MATAILAFGVPGALTRSNELGILTGAAGALAFAANLRTPIGRRFRLLAVIIQVLAIVSTVGPIVTVLLMAEGGRPVWQDAPMWSWLVIPALLIILGVATADGVRAYREEKAAV